MHNIKMNQGLDGAHTDFYDLYGDGSILMIFTPGHGPGHQLFLINLPHSEPLLLTVDAANTLDHGHEKALPGFLASTVATVRSVRKLKELARKTRAVAVPGMTLTRGPSLSKRRPTTVEIMPRPFRRIS